MENIKINLITLLLLITTTIFSQTFTELTNTSLYGASSGSVDWGDYDNDGHLDILMSGLVAADMGTTVIYKNNGDNTFTKQSNIPLQGVYSSYAKWLDYDNDGYLDVLISGRVSTIKNRANDQTILYRNNGNNTFLQQTNISLIFPKTIARFDCGDYNNDGYLDIIFSTPTNAKIFKNNGNNSFTEQTNVILPACQSVSWGDFNKDEKLDILLSSKVDTKIYWNNGNNTFSENTGDPFPDSQYAVCDDFDNDGNLDFLLIRSGNSKLFRNNGNSTFTDITDTAFPDGINGTAAWGDYDNDGDLDLVTAPNGKTHIYRNDGENKFSELTDSSLAGLYDCSVSWGDYDKDGDPDILLMGCEVYYYIPKMKIFTNSTISKPQAINELTDDLNFNIFPNIVSNNVLITTNYSVESQINIYSLNGCLVKTEKLMTNSIEIDMSKFSEGVYLLELIYNKLSVTKKIIKI